MPGTRTSAFKCPPQLPRKLLRELSRNPVVAGQPVTVLQSVFDELRYKIAMRAFPVDHLWQIEGSPYEENLLQFAAKIGDLSLAYEMIRLGTNLNTTDQLGRTSLFHAVQLLTMLDLRTEEPQFYPVPDNCDLDPNMGQRLKTLACLLIEQHADVNINWNNVTPLSMLMRSKVKHWDLIELLIAHGAREGVGSRDASRVSRVERKYISELQRTRPSTRPPRPCPCFSGRLLSDCHGKGPRPYPHHFMCPCQSGSVYAKCCQKRKVSWHDIWNTEQGIIEPWRKDLPMYLPLSQDAATLLSRIRKVYRTPLLPITEMFRRPTDVPLAVAQVGAPPEMEDMAMVPVCVDELLRSGSVDPAFAFAVKRVRWNARPLGRKVPKNYAAELARAFNEHVDDYIASARDSRDKIEIEIGAKLGSSCGALYRACEAEGCKEQEGRSSARFKYCQECRMAVYCSVKCQRAHWNVHKNVCCAPFQVEQPLPSQRVLQESLSQIVEVMCCGLIHRIKNLEPERFVQLFPEGMPEKYAIPADIDVTHAFQRLSA